MRRVIDKLSPATWTALTAVLLLAVMASKWLVPWLTREESSRVATPVPPAAVQVAEIKLEPRRSLCVDNIVFPKEAGAIGMSGRAVDARPAPKLGVRVSAGGWSGSAAIAQGWAGGLNAAVGSPPRDVVASVCLVNLGRYAAIINGNPDPAKIGRARAAIDGEAIAGAPQLELRVAKVQSRISRAGFMLHRAAQLTWRPLADWSVTVIALLALALTLVCGVGATAWAMARDADDPGGEQ